MMEYGVPQNASHVYFLKVEEEEMSAARVSDDRPDGQALQPEHNVLFTEVLDLAETTPSMGQEGKPRADLLLSVGRGSTLRACGPLGEALLGQPSRSAVAEAPASAKASSVAVSLWRLVDINTCLWRQGMEASQLDNGFEAALAVEA